MERMSLVLVVLAALCAAPSAAFLQDLLLHPLQEMKHALQPQYPQPQYQYAQPQYRRAAYDTPLPPQQGYAGYAGYTNSRPILYQWLPSPTRPVNNNYEAGSAYSYSSNPWTNFWQQQNQNSWLPWANRQPVQQQQQLQAQPLSASMQPVVQQQPQQPLQAFWSILPWNSNAQASQGGVNGNPVLSFLQNPGAVLPWNQQNAKPAVIYTTPLAPSSSHASSTLHVVSEAPAAVDSALSAAPSVHVKPEGVVLDDSLSVQHIADKGVRRIAVEGAPCV